METKKKSKTTKLDWLQSFFKIKGKNGLCGFYVFTSELAQQLKCPGFCCFFFLNDEDVLHCCIVHNCKYILAYV